MKLSDYIVERLVGWGVRHVFLVTGGGAMHLNNSIGGDPRLQYVCNHHEQASAMAAEAYARVTGQTGVINVTTGPGGINALNGVFGAWTDSVPVLIISGQVKRETCMRSRGITGLRQLGDQEVDMVSMVANLTKYAVMIDDPQSLRYHLERAWHLTQSGRPGPCWLDIPVDVQAASVDPDKLRAYDPAEDHAVQSGTIDSSPLQAHCQEPAFVRPTPSLNLANFFIAWAFRCPPHGRTMSSPPTILFFAGARERSAIARETSPCKTPTCF
jgi:acetolactate synthase-1/2/3 large subunit